MQVASQDVDSTLSAVYELQSVNTRRVKYIKFLLGIYSQHVCDHIRII